eukprot:TRINITY_DN12252_c1_g1_i1.p1 TRINITY_DN12252_c1_g1~~TRINITY_DN12252_c1_g1_i1.p1  ORF type:complete len:1272 (+),score=391.67 TRINITY_DN12252_c1_g1_i1:146-3961(+)
MASRANAQSPLPRRQRPTVDEHAADKQLQHAMSRAINAEHRPPKESSVGTVVELTLQYRSAVHFFRNVPRLHNINKHPVIAWKSLGVTHRLLHVLTHDMLLESSRSFEETVTYLGRLHEQDTTVYGKACSLLSQLEVAKLQFHKKYAGFDSDMSTAVAVPSLSQQHGRELAVALAGLQQLNIVTAKVVLDMVSGLQSSSSRHRAKEFREQACLLWPLYSVLQESVTGYEILLHLLRQLTKEEKDVFGVMRQFQDQHNKLRHIYTRVRQIPYLFARLTTLDLSGPCPDILSESAFVPPRVKPSVEARDFIAKFDDDDVQLVAPAHGSPAVARRGTAPSRSATSNATSKKPDPREAKLQEIRQELDKANQEREDQKGIIASLEHHIAELTGGLTNVDPRAIAELQASGLGVQKTLREQLEDAQTELEQLRDELMDITQDRDTAQAMMTSLQDELASHQRQVEVAESDLAATQAMLHDVEEQFDQHQREANLTQASIDQLHQDKEKMQSELTQLHQRLEAAITDKSELESQLTEQANKHDRQEAEHAMELSRLQHTIEATEAELAAGKELVESHQVESRLLQGREKQLQGNVDHLESYRKELEAKVLTMQEKVENATQEAIASMERELEGRELLATVRNEKLALLKQLDEASAKLTAVEKQFEQVSEDHIASQEHLSALQSQHKVEIEQLQADLEQSNARALKSLQDEAHISTAMEELQAQVASLQSSKQALQAQHAELETAHRETNQAKSRLQVELNQRQEALEKATQQLERERHSSLSQLQNLETSLSETKAKADSQEQAFKAQVARLEKEATVSAKTISSLEQSKLELEGKLVASRTAVDKVQAQLETVRQQHKAQLASMQEQQATNASQYQEELARVQFEAVDKSKMKEDQLLSQFAAGLTTLASTVTGLEHASEYQLLDECTTTLSAVSEDTGTPSLVKSATEAVAYVAVVAHTLLRRITVEASGQEEQLSREVEETTVAFVAAICARLKDRKAPLPLVHIRTLSTIAGNLDALSNKYAMDLEAQMAKAQTAIQSASARVQGMLDEIKAGMDKAKLDVHETILDQSLKLIATIDQLTSSAGVLQAEIVEGETAAGKKVNKSQFYKRNSRWVDGLVSAAKAVGSGVSVLVDTSDRALHGEARLEEIMVCGQEIAASTAQLVSASRVKAKLDSKNKVALEQDSKKVQVQTKALIEAVREACHKAKEAQSAQDYLKLSLTQAKRLQMDSQVRVLQLETELLNEQERLRQLRKAQYQLAEQTGIHRSPHASAS